MTKPETITVYWRPGCGFCSKLLRGLDNRGIPHTRINIWDEPTAAARVRAITGGNETVPTVTVGDRALVNPRLGEVLRLADPAATTVREPDASPPDGHRRRRRWERAFGALGWCPSLVPDPVDTRTQAKMDS
ncbi:MAG: glutaredoxin family protein [Ilumatobacteraceae bacterium]